MRSLPWRLSLAPVVLAVAAGATAADARESWTGPRVVDVRYVHRQPLGDAPPRPALVVRATDPDGQVVAVEVRVGRRVGAADGDCHLGGKRTGGVERWVMPVGALAPGRHRVRVTVESSPCDGRAGGGQAASRVVSVTVGARPPAAAPPRPADPGTPQPPPAWVAVGRRSRWLAFGSYCWSSAAPDGSGSALCQDTVPPEARRDLPTLTVARGQTLRFQLGFEPVEAGLALDGRPAVRLEPARRMTWRMTGRRASTLTLFARARDGGDVRYEARLRRP